MLTTPLPPAEPLLRASWILPLVLAARPLHAASALLVLAPVLAARVFDHFTARQAIGAFVVMVLCSAGASLVQDVVAALEQRAARRYPAWVALGSGLLLLFAAAVLARQDGRMLLLAMLAFTAMSLALAAGLGRLPGLRVAVPGVLLAWPLLAGSAATGIAAPGWMIAAVLTITMMLAWWWRAPPAARPVSYLPALAAGTGAALALALLLLRHLN